MKIEPRLPQLPSLSELLEHPRVKGLVERVNRSTIAQRAGGFLEEVRATLAERAGRIEIPSLTHLAERLARRLLGEPTAAGPVINATGLLFGDESLAPPLPEPALLAIVQMAGEFHARDEALARSVERALCQLVPAEAAHIISSFEGTLSLAVAAIAGGREVRVHGGANDSGPIDWRKVAVQGGAVMRSDGDGHPSAIVRTPSEEIPSLATLAAVKSTESCLIDVAPLAGLMNPREFGYESVETISERLAAGADIVIVDGGGLLGGPACGIVMGARHYVEPLARHALASMLEADALTVAALGALLKIYREDGDAAPVFQLPMWQLLSAPLANLEQRARRLSTLMAEAPGIASAQPFEVQSAWRRWGERQWKSKSWCIELTPSSGDAGTLSSKLGQGPYAVAVRHSQEAVQLDLRTVFPRWDQQLVAAVDRWDRQAPSSD